MRNGSASNGLAVLAILAFAKKFRHMQGNIKPAKQFEPWEKMKYWEVFNIHLGVRVPVTYWGKDGIRQFLVLKTLKTIILARF